MEKEFEAAPDAGEPTLEEQLRSERDRWLRLAAEMDNLRKRTRREVEDARRFARADALRPLLDVHDNLERALAATGEATALRQGVELVAQSFRQSLLDQGVREIETADREFDPALHEAVGQQPASEEIPSGVIVAVVQKGYLLDDELVLRPARVIVAG